MNICTNCPQLGWIAKAKEAPFQFPNKAGDSFQLVSGTGFLPEFKKSGCWLYWNLTVTGNGPGLETNPRDCTSMNRSQSVSSCLIPKG